MAVKFAASQPEYVTAEAFRDRCFAEDHSYLFADETVWTQENLRAVIDGMEKAWIEAGRKTFMETLKYQLAALAPECTKLAADALVLYYLFPVSDNIKKETKEAQIAAVLSWIGLSAPHVLSTAFGGGIAHVGPHYTIAQDQVISGFLQFALSGKAQSIDFTSMTDCESVLASLRETSKIPKEVSHALLHLLFPSEYEPIVSERHKRAIVRKYAPEQSNAPDVDAVLRNLRPILEERFGAGFHYYLPTVRQEWDTESITRSSTLPKAADIFVAPIPGSGVAYQRSLYSVAYPINRVKVEQFVSDDTADRITRLSGNGQFYAWAAEDTPQNRSYWQKIKSGDAVLFYGGGAYNYVAYIIATLENEQLAEELWTVGEDSGRDHRLIYFLTQPRSITVPLSAAAAYIRDSSPQQFYKVSEEKRDAILAEFDTINDFVERIFIEPSQTYLSLRSNHGSDWQDQEGVSYHFGDSVANYLKVRPGARFVIERRFETGGYKIIGVGRIGEVQRLPKSGDGKTSFVASYSEYTAVTPPRAIEGAAREALVRSPGWNQQHSIHVISAEAFRLLSGEQLTLQEPTDPAGTLAEILYWDRQRATELLTLAASKRGHQILFYGPPGTGKTYTAFALANVLAPEGFGYVEKVQFHPSYSYEDFIEGIRPRLDVVSEIPATTTEGNASSSLAGASVLQYRLVDGVFKDFVKRAQRDPAKKYVFVIDELNRANLASVFGELLYCLEYRGPNHSITLPYSHEKFWLPENLWIIGTMNTADRSIALVDAAFRRRFKHWQLPPDYSALRLWLDKNGFGDRARVVVTRLEELNRNLLPRLGADRLIGQSFFMTDNIDSETFERIWDEDLEPVLHEHFFGLESDLSEFKKIFVEPNE